MGVFDKARRTTDGDLEGRPYVCLSCERRFEVQYHSCPLCGAYDIRREKWVDL